jgi:hypothetical protein
MDHVPTQKVYSNRLSARAVDEILGMDRFALNGEAAFVDARRVGEDALSEKGHMPVSLLGNAAQRYER